MQIVDKDKEIDLLARTAWGEARGEGVSGMQAVINVVQNRVARGGWWGATIEDVVLKPWQFSAWNANDPNRAKLLAVDASTISESTKAPTIVIEQAQVNQTPSSGGLDYMSLAKWAGIASIAWLAFNKLGRR